MTGKTEAAETMETRDSNLTTGLGLRAVHCAKLRLSLN